MTKSPYEIIVVCCRQLGMVALFMIALTIVFMSPTFAEQKENKTMSSVISHWPFQKPSLSVLRKCPRKVFAHYITQYPISEDNIDPSQDYYALQYLKPEGEHGKHSQCGGYLRERPLPRSVLADTHWRDRDMETEVKRASEIGLDGFTLDILSDHGYHWEAANCLMAAAERVDPGFKIIPMLDMDCDLNNGNNDKPLSEKLADVIKALSRYSSAYRLADGRIVVIAYHADVESVKWWQAWLAKLKNEGIDIAFIPLFHNWKQYAAEFAPISFGLSDWGWRSVKIQSAWLQAPALAHKYCPVWMMPVSPQDMRPYSLIYSEAHNSMQFRTMWENAIHGHADWVHIITWNDYSESTEIAPSSGIQYSFYDLAAYYITWFKTGQKPKITGDMLFYFCRNQSTDAKPDLQKQSKIFSTAEGTDPPVNNIELLAFLAKPGSLVIEAGGKIYRKGAAAGITSFSIPLVEGSPSFRLIRAGAPVIHLDCDFTIDNHIIYQDLLYRSGDSRLHSLQ